jgi:hypothetical protein
MNNSKTGLHQGVLMFGFGTFRLVFMATQSCFNAKTCAWLVVVSAGAR